MNPLFDKSLVKNSVIVFIGAPLVGKGTQSKLLADFLGVPVVSSGDVFREVAKSGSPLGNELHSIMSQGGLVPNELVLEVFLEYLAQLQFAEGFILDGFVRELENLDTLHYICEELGLKLLTFVYLQEPSEEDLLQRLEQRVEECKRQGIPLRADDRVDVFQRRWKVYQEKTLPVIEYLRVNSNRYHLLTVALKGEEGEGDSSKGLLLSKDVIFTQIQEKLINLIFSSSSSFSFNRSYRASTADPASPSLFDLARLLSHKLEQLESQLSSKYQSIDKTTMAALLASYLRLSLQYNANKRTGLTRRCVFLVSSNHHKLQEFVRIFDYYGIEVLLLPHELRYRYYSIFYEVLKQPPFLGSGVSIIGIIKEYTSLIRYYSMRIKDEKISNNEIKRDQFIQAEIRHNAKVVHLSQLDIFEYDISIEKVIKRQFLYKTPGYIDVTRSSHSHDIFGWDDIFVVEKNGWTYNQLKQFGFKISSRDMNISLWMKEKIYYKKLTDLNFTPLLPIPSPPPSLTVSNVLTPPTAQDGKIANSKVFRSIDFHIDVYEDFFLKHPYYSLNNDVIMKQSDLLYLFYHVMNQGIYFRASHNRRLKNYWCPGLNAGLPLTPKKDEIHEATFLVHDFGHFGLPDLIYIGETTSSLHKLVYITWRMLSEALTMTISDMIFVDTLVKGKIQYDYEKRAIYPLFAALDLPIFYPTSPTSELPTPSPSSCHYKMDLTNLKKIIRANYRYCLLGDDSEYRQLLKEAAQRLGQRKGEKKEREREGEGDQINDISLLKFQSKYAAFFIEDFKWTNYNYENMCQKSDSIARWWKQIQPLLHPSQPSQQDSLYPVFYTIDDIIERLQLKEIWFNTSSSHTTSGEGRGRDVEECDDYERRARDVIDIMFEYIIEHMIFPLFSETSIESKEVRRDRAFRRYFLGQCAIFAKYDVIPESEETFQQLLQLMMTSSSSSSSSSKTLSIEVIDEIRLKYDNYLELLVEKNLISEDDKLTYAESFPLFDPMYLTYDQDHSHLSLKDIAAEILFEKPRFFYSTSTSTSASASTSNSEGVQGGNTSSAMGLYPLLPNYTPSKQERFYLHVMQVLLEHTEAHFVDDVFVVKPGVMLLSDVNGFEHRKNLLTFLIAGVSVEASLELIGHREASVARLTSSKTNAMNLPFYRIFSALHRSSESNDDVHGQNRHSYQNTLLQKQLIRDIQLIRQQYQQQFRQLNVEKRSSNDVSNGNMREKDSQEMLNMFNEANKCTFLCYSMTIEDLHKLFIGRAGYDGNESEVREVVKMMHHIVKERYHQSFLSWEDYLQANNLSKVTSSSSSLPSSITTTSLPSMIKSDEVLQTSLTREAKRLFTALNINKEQAEYLQLADFRSRVTYLSFPKTYQKDLTSVLNYHRKVIVDLGHMSVLAAYQIAVKKEGSSEVTLITTKEAMARVMQNKTTHGDHNNRYDPYHILIRFFKDLSKWFFIFVFLISLLSGYSRIVNDSYESTYIDAKQ